MIPYLSGTDTEFAGSGVFVDGTGTAGDGDKAFQVGKDANQTITAGEVEISADSIGGADLSAQDTAITSAGLALLDTAIAGVAGTRGDLGAVQNRLESTVRNLSVTSENLAAAESRIRDVDVAEEMMSFTRSQILQQAGTAMLAQANGVSQGALQLLG